jgi:hypothetical protein
MARQAQSRMKMLSKLEEEMVSVEGDDSKFNLEFPETDTLPPPCISVSNVAFGWNYGDVLYEVLGRFPDWRSDWSVGRSVMVLSHSACGIRALACDR